MKRDGANFSIWQEAMKDFQPGLFEQSDVYDVVIAGGGITGVSVAHLLQRNGLKCLIAEAKNLGFGTTSGTTAHLNTILDLDYSQLQNKFGDDGAKLILTATREAIDHVAANISDYQIDCDFQRKAGYLFAQTEEEADKLERVYEASRNAGCDVYFSEEIPVPIPFTKSLRYADQGQFHPIKYLYALAREFEKKGGHISQNCRVTQVEKEEELLRIETSEGQIRARHLIYATHIPPGVNVLHFKCAPYRSYAMACLLENDDYPDEVVYDMEEPYHYYRTHKINGERYLIAGGNDHKTAEETNTDQCFTDLEAYLKKHFSIREMTYRWSSQFFDPVDGLPYIGHLPGNPPNVYVATGFGGNGITFSQVAALLLTDMLLGKDNRYEKLFSPSRIKPIAGFSKFVSEAADVVGHLISAPFDGEKIKELSSISPGEGRVISYENEQLAVYKDEQGNIHSLNPACTHIKCTIAFNHSEKVWECPCHGSRFSIDGEVYTAPARKDLQRISLNK